MDYSNYLFKKFKHMTIDDLAWEFKQIQQAKANCEPIIYTNAVEKAILDVLDAKDVFFRKEFKLKLKKINSIH